MRIARRIARPSQFSCVRSGGSAIARVAVHPGRLLVAEFDRIQLLQKTLLDVDVQRVTGTPPTVTLPVTLVLDEQPIRSRQAAGTRARRASTSRGMGVLVGRKGRRKVAGTLRVPSEGTATECACHLDQVTGRGRLRCRSCWTCRPTWSWRPGS